MDFLKGAFKNPNDMMANMESLWKTLDDLAENNPDMYREFMQNTQKDYLKEEGFTPTPHYVITMPLHEKNMLPTNNLPGKFVHEMAVNITTHERVKKSTWNTAEHPAYFSMGVRSERVVKGKTKAYIDVCLNPADLPPKPADGATVIRTKIFDAILGQVVHAESAKAGKQLVPGALPGVDSAKYLGDTKVKVHVLRLIGSPPAGHAGPSAKDQGLIAELTEEMAKVEKKKAEEAKGAAAKSGGSILEQKRKVEEEGGLKELKTSTTPTPAQNLQRAAQGGFGHGGWKVQQQTASKQNFCLIEEIDPLTGETVKPKPLAELPEEPSPLATAAQDDTLLKPVFTRPVATEPVAPKPKPGFTRMMIQEESDDEEEEASPVVSRPSAPRVTESLDLPSNTSVAARLVDKILSEPPKAPIAPTAAPAKKIEEVTVSKPSVVKDDDKDDRVLRDGNIRLPGRLLVAEDEMGDWMAEKDRQVEEERRRKLYEETENSKVDIFAATKPPVKKVNKVLIEEL